MQVKYRKFVFYKLYFVFDSSLFDSIISSNVITESSIILAKYFPFSQLQVAGFQTYSFSHIWCFLHSHWHLSLFHYLFDLQFVSSNLHLHSYEVCILNVFATFIPVIRLKTLRFKLFVLFEKHCKLIRLGWILHFWLLNKNALCVIRSIN